MFIENGAYTCTCKAANKPACVYRAAVYLAKLQASGAKVVGLTPTTRAARPMRRLEACDPSAVLALVDGASTTGGAGVIADAVPWLGEALWPENGSAEQPGYLLYGNRVPRLAPQLLLNGGHHGR